MMVPVRRRPRGSAPYPCPRCHRLLSPTNHLCTHCAETRGLRRRELLQKQLRGGRPFFLAAVVVVLLLVLYVLLG